MRVRKQLITNLYIKDKDIKRLANGYVVYKRANKHAHALIPKAKADATAKAKMLAKKVLYHKRALEKLIGKLPADGITSIKVKKPYTKKNLAYWNNYKGNNPNFPLKKGVKDVQQTPLSTDSTSNKQGVNA